MVMADSIEESKHEGEGICWKITKWAKCHFLAMNFFVVGVVGAISSAFLIEDVEWKVATFMHFNALAACSVVSLICKRGSAYCTRFNDARGRIKSNRKAASRSAQSKKPECTETKPLLPEHKSSNIQEETETPPPLFDLEGNRDELKFSTFKGPYKKTEGVKSETGARPKDSQAQTIVADVHHSGSVPASPVTASPYRATPENESASSGANPSSTPDSGITVQTTAQTPQSSGEGQEQPPPPEL